MEVEEGTEEGRFLLGAPTFKDIGNGRVRCVETGHELPAKDAEAYGMTKGCRTGLIDDAMAKKKPPLNMFKSDPLSKSKLICKLTGHTINKTEGHVWKHITGKRFLSELEKKEKEKLPPASKKNTKKLKKRRKDPSKIGWNKKVPKNGEIQVDATTEAEHASSGGDFKETEPANDDNDNNELDFWIPPVGECWDFDGGEDRQASCTNSGIKKEEDLEDGAVVDDDVESADLSTRAKRMSIAVGPSSFASTKKKSRTIDQPKDCQRA